MKVRPRTCSWNERRNVQQDTKTLWSLAGIFHYSRAKVVYQTWPVLIFFCWNNRCKELGTESRKERKSIPYNNILPIYINVKQRMAGHLIFLLKKLLQSGTTWNTIWGKIRNAYRTGITPEESHRGHRKETDANDPVWLASGQKIRQPSGRIKNEMNRPAGFWPVLLQMKMIGFAACRRSELKSFWTASFCTAAKGRYVTYHWLFFTKEMLFFSENQAWIFAFYDVCFSC